MRTGVDYAWGRPSTSSLLSAGVTFAVRYLSYDSSGKNLDRDEVDRLTAAGIDVVANWEWDSHDMLDGYNRGREHAAEAQGQAEACGMPADRPIYFSADFDATEGQQAAINAYLDGAASVLGRDRVGNEAHAEDFGQWNANTGENMAQLDDIKAQLDDLQKLVVMLIENDKTTDATGKHTPIAGRTGILAAGNGVKQELDGLTLTVAALGEKVDKLAVGGVDVAALAAALAGHLPAVPTAAEVATAVRLDEAAHLGRD